LTSGAAQLKSLGMSKDDLLFTIIGLLLGFILGYVLTNNYNQRLALAGPANSALLNEATPAGDNAEEKQIEPEPEKPDADPQVLAEAQKRADGEPTNYEIQMQAGEVFYRAWRYAEAAKFLERAVKLRPKEVEPLVALGNTYFDDAARNNANDKWPLAEKTYQAALALEAKNPSVRTDLGLTFFYREPPDYDRALQEFRKTLETVPNHEPALQNVASVYLKKGDKAQAEKALAALEKVNPANPALPTLRGELEKLK
jgi:tetratricopeptide (TPR) repeat protein